MSPGKLPLLPDNNRGGLIHSAFVKLYTWLFARPSAQGINDRLLHLALKGRGYNLGTDPKDTGELRFLRNLAQTHPTLCVDIGANRGKYSTILLETTTSRVIAFEPLPQSYRELKRLLTTYPDRFIPEQLGVGKEDATLQLRFGNDTALASFSQDVGEIGYVGAVNVNTIDVPVVSLDSYFASPEHHVKEIDLIKIDAEGFEFEILVGAENTISEVRPKFIQLEFNWHQLYRRQSLHDLAALLPNYEAYQILPHGSGLVKRDLGTPDANIYHFSNFVFIRNDIQLGML